MNTTLGKSNIGNELQPRFYNLKCKSLEEFLHGKQKHLALEYII